MTATFDFTGKVALITGSSSGIGAHAAQEFSRFSAQVVITGRDKVRLHEVYQQCVDVSPTKLKPLVVALDMSCEDVISLVAKTVKVFGKLDVLVNSAAMFEFCFVNSELFQETFDKFMQLNLKSILLLTRAAMPHLKASKGCIINVSGLGSTMPGVGMMSHSCAKAALEIMAKEFKGVRVNCIKPAVIHTPLTDRFFDKTVEAFLARTGEQYPIGRPGEVRDTSDAIMFLASSRASFLTGVILPVAGGADLSSDTLEVLAAT